MYIFILIFFSNLCLAINLCDVAVFWPLTSDSPTLNEKLASNTILKTTQDEKDPFYLKISDALSKIENEKLKLIPFVDKHRDVLLSASLKDNTFTVSIHSLKKKAPKEETILNAANTKRLLSAILRAYLLKLQTNPNLELKLVARDVRNDQLRKIIKHLEFQQAHDADKVSLFYTFAKTISVGMFYQNNNIESVFTYLYAMLAKKYKLFTHPGNDYFIMIRPKSNGESTEPAK